VTELNHRGNVKFKISDRRNVAKWVKPSVTDTNRGLASMALNVNVNEFGLWHGTKPKTSDIIVKHGFDERLAVTTGMYGAGIYFTEFSSKAHQYRGTRRSASQEHVESMRDGMHCMLYSHVMMGEPFATKTTHSPSTSNLSGLVRRAPEMPEYPGREYDSIFAEKNVANSGKQLHNEYHLCIIIIMIRTLE
jgi:hypothetical protein